MAAQYITNKERVMLLQQSLNGKYTFNREWLALQALQVSGGSQFFDGSTEDIPNNKRLAILGDRLLDLHLSREWFESGTSRERFSTRRNHIASNKNLAEIGRMRKLDKCIVRKPAPQPVGDEAMATTIEAILGAVFLDAQEVDKDTAIDAVVAVASELGLNFDESSF